MNEKAPTADERAKALGDELAFPCLPPVDPNGGGSAGGYPYPEMGMRKRELFAAMALQGMLSNPGHAEQLHSHSGRAALSVLAADALLKELARG